MTNPRMNLIYDFNIQTSIIFWMFFMMEIDQISKEIKFMSNFMKIKQN
jgi:hypothetical protein